MYSSNPRSVVASWLHARRCRCGVFRSKETSHDMKFALPRFVLLYLAFVAAVAAGAPARPNVLFIAVDDLRNDLGAFGAAHAKTPKLDAFAATARVFDHHYVQVPTCGASRCALLRGRYPSEPGQLANTAIARTHSRWGDANLPAWFKRHGYQTFALGKITHHPGGLTGKQ